MIHLHHLAWWAYMLIGFLITQDASLLTTVYLHRGVNASLGEVQSCP